jgi:glycosyltransferase involved in cell wall biosynthesis
MPDGGAHKPRILLAHQWKSDHGLYGSDKMALRVLRELASIVEPIVFVESEGEFTDVARSFGVPVIVRPMGVLRRKHMNPPGLAHCAFHVLKTSLWMARYIRLHNIQLIITSTISVVAAALAARLAARTHIWLVQEVLVGPETALSFFASAFSRRIIAVSEASARSIHRGRKAAAEKVLVAYPGVDVLQLDCADGTPIRQKFSTPEQPVLIGLIGRLHYRKGQEYFLHALHELKKRNVGGFRALIIGDAYKDYPDMPERLRRKTSQLGLEKEVFFCGHQDDIHAFYRALDIVVAPSILPEAFSLVVAEAMAARLAVVATRLGGPSEMIEDGVSGFVIPPDDPVQFSHRLEELIQSSQLRRKLGQEARHRIETGFSVSAFDAKIRAEVLALIKSHQILSATMAGS